MTRAGLHTHYCFCSLVIFSRTPDFPVSVLELLRGLHRQEVRGPYYLYLQVFLSISLFAFVSEFVVVSNLYLSPFLYLVLCWRGLHRLWAGSSRQPEG